MSRGRKKPLLFSWRAPQGREATMVPVGVWYTSGHEVVQQVRPTGEPDGTTSGPALTTTPSVVPPFHCVASAISYLPRTPAMLALHASRSHLYLRHRTPSLRTILKGGSIQVRP